MPRVHLEKLIVETTQACNIACEHCGRDKPRMKEISKETIDNLARQVKYVGNLSITGGEPFLAPEPAENLAEAFMQPDGPRLFSWNVIANGTIWNDKVKEALRKLHLAANMLNEDSELSPEGKIAISNTKWHKDARKEANISKHRLARNKKLMRESAEYIGVKRFNFNYGFDLDELHDMGRAKKVDISKIEKICSRPKFEMREMDNGDIHIKGNIYIDVDGNVCPWGASMEYDEQASRAWGNINKEPLYDILKRAKEQIICPALSTWEKLKEVKGGGVDRQGTWQEWHRALRGNK